MESIRSQCPAFPVLLKIKAIGPMRHVIILLMMLGVSASCLMLLFAINTSYQRGLDLYHQHKYAEAIPALEEAAQAEDPHSAEYKETVLLIGQSYFLLSQAPKAIPWLEKVPMVNEANYMLGYAYLQTGQQQKSEAAFARLFGLKPDSAGAHLLAGQMMLKKEYETQAMTEVQQAIALDPKLPEAHFLLAEMEIYRGQLDAAIEDLQRELAINPNFSMAWYRLGDAYTRQEKWDLAIPNLQRAIWLNPDFSGPFILLGKCYFKQHNYSNAEGILRRALILDPQNASATYLLGQTLMLMGKTAEGRAMLQKWRTLQQGQQNPLP
jgi:tetratricopeptide (TPR) repeat protein